MKATQVFFSAQKFQFIFRVLCLSFFPKGEKLTVNELVTSVCNGVVVKTCTFQNLQLFLCRESFAENSGPKIPQILFCLDARSVSPFGLPVAITAFVIDDFSQLYQNLIISTEALFPEVTFQTKPSYR